jgi:hypothetical protein
MGCSEDVAVVFSPLLFWSRCCPRQDLAMERRSNGDENDDLQISIVIVIWLVQSPIYWFIREKTTIKNKNISFDTKLSSNDIF